MKKIVLTLVALMSMTMAFAENVEAKSANTAEAYNMTVNYDKLAEALSLSVDQLDAVKDIHKTFCVEMMNAGNAAKEEQKAAMNKAIEKDLKFMHHVLSNKQYRKYLLLLNTTINNRGLNK